MAESAINDLERLEAETALHLAMVYLLEPGTPVEDLSRAERIAKAHALAAIGQAWATMALERVAQGSVVDVVELAPAAQPFQPLPGPGEPWLN